MPQPQPCSSPAARTRWCCCAAEKASAPGAFLSRCCTSYGHNFSEVIAFRDHRAAELGERLIVRSVEDRLQGRVVSARWRRAATPPIRDAARRDREFGFDACIGGARRDDGKGRAKERIVLVSRRVATWDPKNHGPSLEPFQCRVAHASTCAVFRQHTGPSSTCGST